MLDTCSVIKKKNKNRRINGNQTEILDDKIYKLT